MRGFKRNETETIARQYLDSDSFVSMPKEIPDCPNLEHELLAGNDKGRQRERLHNRAHGQCERCGNRAPLNIGWGWVVPGEWSHKAVKPADRCDCYEASEWLCNLCHKKIHAGRRPQWTKSS